MAYNPLIHHRKSIRMKGFNYSIPGSYFITICTQGRKPFFGKIINGEMVLNEFGMIAYQEWETLPERFMNLVLDVCQIMPNHMHGIITLTDIVGETLAVAPSHPVDPHFNNCNKIPALGAGASPAPTNIATIGAIVGAYKSLTANNCLNLFKKQYPDKMMGKLWHRNYYEHIIRDIGSHNRISGYIINNPKNWKDDSFNMV